MKKSHIYVNSILADTIKKDFGMNLNVIVEKFLESIINGELQYSNGHWRSVFMRTEIGTSKSVEQNNSVTDSIVINNTPTDESIKITPVAKKASKKNNESEFSRDGVDWCLDMSNEDIIEKLENKYLEPIRNAVDGEFDRYLCGNIFQIKYGEDWWIGDNYEEEPNITKNSLYNFYKKHQRGDIVQKIDYIINMNIDWLKREGMEEEFKY